MRFAAKGIATACGLNKLLLLTVLWVGFSGAVSADANIATRMQAMVEGHRMLDYQGVLTHQHGKDLTSYRVSHIYSNGRETEFFEPLDGEAENTQVVKLTHPVNCIHPGHQLLRFGFTSEGGIKSLSNYYDFTEGAEVRVAGRVASTISITPKDVYRLGYRLAVDAETGMLLRSEILDQSGNLLERFQFVSLTVGDVDLPRNVSAVHNAWHPHPVEVQNSDKVLAQQKWRPSWLPVGFMLSGEARDQGSTQSYTDGLSTFTVFVEQTRGSAAQLQHQRGATVAWAQNQALGSNQLRVTVVGEVPVGTARQVASSVSLANR